MADLAYSYDSGKTWTNTNTETYTVNGNKVIWVQDKLGNVTKKTITISNIDNIAPTYTSVTKSTSNWSKTIKVTVNGLKDESKLAETPYSYDDGKTWVKENQYEYKANGTKTIKMRDYAGNTVTTSIDINNIDSTAPIISNINNNGTTIKAKIKDAQSYVVSYRWTIGANKNNPVYDTGWKSIKGVSTYTATLDVDKYPGEIVYLYAKDEAGNERCQLISGVSFKVESLGKVDNTIQYKIVSTAPAAINESQVQDLIRSTSKISFKVKSLVANSNKEFILTVECPKDMTSSEQIVLKDGTIYYTATQKSQDIVINLDNSTKPTITIGEISSDVTNTSAKVFITVKDNDSGIQRFVSKRS